MKSDIEIAREAEMLTIDQIAGELGLGEGDIEKYGNYKAKLKLETVRKLKERARGKLVLVTAITPTRAGEGKTTTTVGLGQALNRLGKKAIIALREPSLGPTMGIKGGAAGGGYAQVVPMEDINLHFTGDIHAIGTAHNLLAAVLDNHIKQGNQLRIDPTRVHWPRVVDMNDRALRQTVVGLGGTINGQPREDGFIITVASEVMAALCLAEDLQELKERLAKIVVAYNYEGQPVSAADLQVEGAMTALLRDALKPNLVQTLENTPAFIHGGPFANIAHGCNSLMATRMALKLSEITVTEAGFGADLGAEKFFNIKSRVGNLQPEAAVLVATVRALKLHGGVAEDNLDEENLEALEAGLPNLEKHIENIRKYGVPLIVAINRFSMDSEREISFLRQSCEEMGIKVAISEVWAEGGAGGEDLARGVLEVLESQKSDFSYLYETEASIRDKIATISREMYGASGVEYSDKAEEQIVRYREMGYSDLPICMAKTPASLSDNPGLKGQPRDFKVSVRDITLSAGAGFLVVLTGPVLKMPGLPAVPSAEKIDIDKQGQISGLF